MKHTNELEREREALSQRSSRIPCNTAGAVTAIIFVGDCILHLAEMIESIGRRVPYGPQGPQGYDGRHHPDFSDSSAPPR